MSSFQPSHSVAQPANGLQQVFLGIIDVFPKNIGKPGEIALILHRLPGLAVGAPGGNPRPQFFGSPEDFSAYVNGFWDFAARIPGSPCARIDVAPCGGIGCR
jgi:hypothetical protein